VPDNFTWVVKFSGMAGMVGSRAGLLIATDPVTGESYGDFWEKLNGEWKLYQVSSDPSLDSHFSAVVHGYDKTSTTLIYVPESGYTGTDSFACTVYDYFNFRDNAGVTITVAQNDGQNSRSIQKGAFQLINYVDFGTNPFGFSYQTQPNKIYTVEYSSDLRQWLPLESVKGTGNSIKFVEQREPFFGQHIYKIKENI